MYDRMHRAEIVEYFNCSGEWTIKIVYVGYSKDIVLAEHNGNTYERDYKYFEILKFLFEEARKKVEELMDLGEMGGKVVE